VDDDEEDTETDGNSTTTASNNNIVDYHYYGYKSIDTSSISTATEVFNYYLELIASIFFLLGATLEFYSTLLESCVSNTSNEYGSSNGRSTDVIITRENEEAAEQADWMDDHDDDVVDDDYEENVDYPIYDGSIQVEQQEQEQREQQQLPWYLSYTKTYFIAMHLYLLSFVLSLIQLSLSSSSSSSSSSVSPLHKHKHLKTSLSPSSSEAGAAAGLSVMILAVKWLTIIGLVLLVSGTVLDCGISYLYNPDISQYINPRIKLILPIQNIKEVTLAIFDLFSSSLWNVNAILCMTADIIMVLYHNNNNNNNHSSLPYDPNDVTTPNNNNNDNDNDNEARLQQK